MMVFRVPLDTTSCGRGHNVRCPFCGSDESRVVDSRESESGDAIRRRRECLDCDRRYTTYERIEEVPLAVVKSDGSEQVFSRQKVLNGMLRACEKRGIPIERLERAVDAIESSLRRVPGSVSTQMVGESALHHLREIDKVAYVRFASVYRQFDDIDEFHEELERLELAGREPLPGERHLPGLEPELDEVIPFVSMNPQHGATTRGSTGNV